MLSGLFITSLLLWKAWSASVSQQEPFNTTLSVACNELNSKLMLEGTTVLNATYVPAGTNLSFPYPDSSCPAWQVTAANMCRIELNVNTSATSQVFMEAWLPDRFYGRMLGTGNGGLNGCPQHDNMNYGAGMGFATVGSNNGHNGNTGKFFLDNPEVINDFAYRAIEVEATLGKRIIAQYYGEDALKKSYFSACSTGGRQGFRAAQSSPDLFDGIVAGSPAMNWNNLCGLAGILRNVLFNSTNPSQLLLSIKDILLVTSDILDQCDGLDGQVDGIIDHPDECNYRPENLLCPAGSNLTSQCLTADKVDIIRTVFSPVYGTEGQLLIDRWDPGATGTIISNIMDNTAAKGDPLGGGSSFFLDWYKYAIFNDSSYTGVNFTRADMELADRINPGGISTFEMDLRPFRDRGGKLLTFHGTQDQLIPLGNSHRYYNGVARTLGTPNLDDFYKMFQIPGMGHCRGGPGAWAFGQSSVDPSMVANDSDHNILLALVDWVENGKAPDGIIGTKYTSDVQALGVEQQRMHCPYPLRSVQKSGGNLTQAEGWECKAV